MESSERTAIPNELIARNAVVYPGSTHYGLQPTHPVKPPLLMRSNAASPMARMSAPKTLLVHPGPLSTALLFPQRKDQSWAEFLDEPFNQPLLVVKRKEGYQER